MDPKNLPTTQGHLTVEQILDNLVIMKDGTISLVLQTTSVNFDLLSEIEQDAKIQAFAQLLNSLTHSTQILIRTKKVNISNYLGYIESFLNKQNSTGLKRQINIYLNFVNNLITRNEVLDKQFFIVIPFRTLPMGKPSQIQSLKRDQPKPVNVERLLEQAKSYLYPKRDHIMKQLVRMGLHSHQLTSRELLELFFEIYNTPRGTQFTNAEEKNQQRLDQKISSTMGQKVKENGSK